jgi:hypothetical protein
VLDDGSGLRSSYWQEEKLKEKRNESCFNFAAFRARVLEIRTHLQKSDVSESCPLSRLILLVYFPLANARSLVGRIFPLAKSSFARFSYVSPW